LITLQEEKEKDAGDASTSGRRARPTTMAA